MPLRETLHVTLDPLAGHVVVLAGPAATRADEPDVEGVTSSLAASTGAHLLSLGLLVAVVTTDDSVIADLERNAEHLGVDPPTSWRADPADPATWERVCQHIEQRVGPVDAVVADPVVLDLVEDVFRSDMRRRGHGAIVPLSPAQDPIEALRRQLRRKP